MNTHPYYAVYQNAQMIYNPFEPSLMNPNNTPVNNTGDPNTKYRYPFFVPGDRYRALMCPESLNFMSQMITKSLQGVHPEGKNITVPEATVRSVADSMFQNSHSDANVLQEMTINYISNYIRTDFETQNKNFNYSIWVTKYDESTGMKQFNDVKLNKIKRNLEWNWNY
jgi:hypothetical protein